MVALYLVLGWMVVFAAKSIIKGLPGLSLLFLFLGGVFYSIGVIFYSMKKVKYAHGIWHLFVLAGSTAHFFAVIYSIQ